jgi:hypothetical protein
MAIAAVLAMGNRSAAMAQSITPNPNLSINGTCAPNLKIAVILDASLSIDDTELGQMRAGIISFLNNLATKAPNRFQVGIVEFGLRADLLQDFTLVNSTNVSGAFTTAINTKFPDRINNWSSVVMDIYTNWEAGFKKAYDTLGSANLVIFITDGNPNARLDTSGNPVVVVTSPTPTQAQAQTAIDETIPVTNLWKSQGTKIIAVGVAEVTPSIPNNFQEITDDSSTLLFSTSPNNIATADYLSISNFNNFGTQIGNLANGICTSTPANVSISSKVFRDANGNKIIDSGEPFTNAGGLNALLYRNNLNTVVATTTVANDGTFSFSGIPGSDNYIAQITTQTLPAVNAAPPSITLPTNWVTTGENLNGTIDATADSKQSIAVATSNIATLNFGIEQLPDSVNVTANSQQTPIGTNRVQVPDLSGTDPEDGNLGTGKSFKITSLPTNGTLYYPNASNVAVAVTLNQIITNYDPTKLTIDPTSNATSTVTFTYAAIDAASREDPSPATVSMPFTNNASVLLVKRITAINGVAIDRYRDNTAAIPQAANDNHPYWPSTLNNDASKGNTNISTFLRGDIDAGKVKPGDTIEYTIYFLNAGGNNARNIRICDRIIGRQTLNGT